MELAVRMMKQLIEIVQALAVLQAHDRSRVADSPVLTFLAEDAGGGGDAADGGECGVGQGALDLEDGLFWRALFPWGNG